MTNQLPQTIQWHASLPAHLRTADAFSEMSTLGAAFESRAFARVSTNNNTFSLVSIDGDTMQVNQIDAGAVYLDMVFIKWAPHVTKTWYEGAFVAGNDAPPSCFSMDGLRPDASSPKVQSPTCAACPKNAFGSAANGKGKACADGQRTAIVLGADTPVILNGAAHVLKAGGEVYGYRLPPMTGKNLRAKVKEAEKAGVNLMGVVLRAKFIAQGEVDFQFLSYLSEEPWNRTRNLAASDDALRACGLDQKPVQYDAVPEHLRVTKEVEEEEAHPLSGLLADTKALVAAERATTQPRKRGRPAQSVATPPAAVVTSTATPSAFPLNAVPQPSNGVIQQPQPSNQSLDDLLASAMA